MSLDTGIHLDDPDAIFVALAAAHADLTPEQSRRFDAALVLLLANQVRSSAVVLAAIEAARETIGASDVPTKPNEGHPGEQG